MKRIFMLGISIGLFVGCTTLPTHSPNDVYTIQAQSRESKGLVPLETRKKHAAIITVASVIGLASFGTPVISTAVILDPIVPAGQTLAWGIPITLLGGLIGGLIGYGVILLDDL